MKLINTVKSTGVFALVLFLFLIPSKAQACRFIPQPFEKLYEQAETAFIGHIKTIENGLVIFDVERGLRGIKDGEEFSVEQGGSSCDIRFSVGDNWLYLGSTQMSGSMMLEDEYGRVVNADNPLIKDTLKYDPRNRKDVHGGVMTESCAPWGGLAFEILLDNRVRAFVYAASSDVEGKTGIAVYKTRLEAGGVSLTQCDEQKLNCHEMSGSVSLGTVSAEEATGRIDITEGEHTSTHMFRVKRDKHPVPCG